MNRTTTFLIAAALLSAATTAGAAAAAKGDDFSTGNMSAAVHTMDSNNDGVISKAEFLKYQEAQYDAMKKNADGQVTAKDITHYLRGPGNK